MELLPIKRALLSVTDKSGLLEFASFLVENGVELVSTGGTCKLLTSNSLPVKEVSTVTGFPEILGGRVKTLHPFIHGGILADKDKPEHLATLSEHQIIPFDLVCVNLYDFSGALAKRLDLRSTIEEIDIGGPCLLRASAKNYHSILVLPGVNFYQEAQKIMQDNAMSVPLSFRKKTAAAAFNSTASYDSMITEWLAKA